MIIRYEIGSHEIKQLCALGVIMKPTPAVKKYSLARGRLNSTITEPSRFTHAQNIEFIAQKLKLKLQYARILIRLILVVVVVEHHYVPESNHCQGTIAKGRQLIRGIVDVSLADAEIRSNRTPAEFS